MDKYESDKYESPVLIATYTVEELQAEAAAVCVRSGWQGYGD